MHEESALYQLFGAYLNIDWPDDYSSTDEAVLDFLESESEEREQLASEIDALLRKDLTDSQLAEHIELSYRPGLAPEGLGHTWRSWLREVQRLIDDSRTDMNTAPNE